MILVAYVAPRIGLRYAIGAGLVGFFAFAATYLGLVYHYHLFGES
jgi:hypothetical protein